MNQAWRQNFLDDIINSIHLLAKANGTPWALGRRRTAKLTGLGHFLEALFSSCFFHELLALFEFCLKVKVGRGHVRISLNSIADQGKLGWSGGKAIDLHSTAVKED